MELYTLTPYSHRDHLAASVLAALGHAGPCGRGRLHIAARLSVDSSCLASSKLGCTSSEGESTATAAAPSFITAEPNSGTLKQWNGRRRGPSVGARGRQPFPAETASHTTSWTRATRREERQNHRALSRRVRGRKLDRYHTKNALSRQGEKNGRQAARLWCMFGRRTMLRYTY